MMPGSEPAPPVIDFRAKDCAQQVRAACEEWGCFVAVHHGLDVDLLQKTLQVGHAFFNLPDEVKRKYDLRNFGARWRGYMPFGGESSLQGSKVDAKEGLYLGADHDPRSPRVLAGLPTWGANVLPDEELPEMRGCVESALKALQALGDRCMDLLSEGLGLPAQHLQDQITEHEPVVLPRMFRYPPVQAKDQWGIGAHSDYGLWTMIVTDAPGLEFLHAKHGWCAVPHLPGGIAMNVGDVLDRLTAGRFKSAYHRARNLSSSQPRLSLPFFYDPAWDARMRTLPLPTPGSSTLRPHPDAPYDGFTEAERNAVQARWAKTKIRCGFDGRVAYSEFLAKKVAKVFPDIVPPSLWKNFDSTSEPSTRHCLVVKVPEKRQTSQLQENIEAARQKVLRHPLYNELQANKTSRAPALDLIRVFMFHHVWAVWDYFQLLKRLQLELTCVQLPWRPRADAQLRRFVNEIVLEEETDLMEDGVSYGSHLELYLKGMDQAGGKAKEGADAMRRFLARLEEDSKLDTADKIARIAREEGAPDVAVAHIRGTLELALDPSAAPQVAAVFAFGREDIIPDMFRELLPRSGDPCSAKLTEVEKKISVFRYYLERHIELDGKDHGPLAIRLVEQLNGQSTSNWTKSTAAVNLALQRRYDLWAGVAAHSRAAA